MADEVEVIAPNAGAEVNPVAPQSTTEAEELPGEALPETEALSTEAEVEEQPEVDLDATPETSGDFEKYKPLFKENPELRTILGREQAFSDIAPNGSFRELKGIVERVPTLEDAEVLASQSADHRAMGEAFRNDPAGFADSLRENDPHAFQQLANKLPEILAASDPNLYESQAKFYSNAVLDNLFLAANRSGNEQAILSLQNVAAMLGVQLGSPRLTGTQDTSEVAKLRRELAERDRADTEGRSAQFWEGTVKDHYDGSMSEIERLIKTSIPTVTDAQLKRMSTEVWDGVNVRLGSQPQTMAQINQFKAGVAKGRTTVSDHKAIVDYTMKRTKQIIPLVWKDVSAEWTKEITAFSKQQIAKKKGITGVTGQAAPVAQRTAAPVKGAKKTFASVFNALKTGSYAASR